MLFHKEYFAHTKYQESDFRCIFTRTLSFSKTVNFLPQTALYPQQAIYLFIFVEVGVSYKIFISLNRAFSLNYLSMFSIFLPCSTFLSPRLTGHCFLYNLYSLKPFMCPYVRIHPCRLLFSLTEYYIASWKICSLFV